MTEPVGSRVGGYRIEGVLGVGGMGAVYRARHPRLPRHDAVKLLAAHYAADPTYRARFEREADRAAALDHPAIVTVYDRGDDSGRLWISMQLVPGTDAGGLLRERPSGLPLAEVVEIVSTIGAALDHAHAAGILHRDVKPGNIFVDRSGSRPRYLLGDFGIAQGHADSRLTQVGSVVGTVDYCSPEQLAGEDVGPRSDQYALAATALHLLTGHRPFGAASSAATVAIRQLAAPSPRASALRPGLPAGVDAALNRAMAPAPAGRFPDNRAFASALFACLTSPIPAAVPPQQSAPAIPPKPAFADAESRARVGFAAKIAAGMLATVAVGTLLIRSMSPDAPVPPATPDAAGPRIVDARGVMDPCLLPAALLREFHLTDLSPGTAPDPVRDCYTTAASGLTVEFAVYPLVLDDPLVSSARAAYLAHGQDLAGLPGWRSYLTQADADAAAPVYCNVAYLGPGESGLLEVYTLLVPSDPAAAFSGDAQRRNLCDSLPLLAAAIAPTVPVA